ncbi:ribonucleoside-triphosphate reductase, adenosylcobalamin-dependent [Xanthobacter wiegelii]|uniref:ribonucleoside-triphosphate reductase, adenosylcobalamin-dependent n=1 Tax=Xanthobacter wiegelii TaxID=3119913 RepID=UPI00372B66F9
METVTAPSFRAQLITRRTYSRPKNDQGTEFESWTETVDRVVGHQRWLWERAKGAPLDAVEDYELGTLRRFMLERKLTTSGRTLWLGGTAVAQTREASQFNCSFEHVETIHDVVDAFWLLLQGCGVGGKPINGILNGFVKPVEVQVIRSTRTIQDWEQGRRGLEHNDVGTYELGGKTHWHLTVGDSAAAWAKAAGKLLAMKQRVDVVVLDFSQVRAAGIRLKGYGWISSGDETVSKAFEEICNILSRRAGKLLRKIDILDVMNWLGTTLSSRRSAEIMVMDAADPEAEAFAVAKKDHWANGQPQRAQSNNSLIFYSKPTKLELKGLFQMMMDAGGSEPGFINGEEALRRAPWFKGVNPCAEILLGNKSFCNLVEVDMGKFLDDPDGLMRAVYIAARANYRQTCVDLRDGVLSASWHELNEFLRLCGVGLTGIVKWLDVRKVSHSKQEIAARLEELRWNAQRGVNNMADELGLPHAKAVTTVKPSGTLSKIMDTTEGVHRPLGKYIFNNVNFSKHDPLVPMLVDAGYRVFDNPYDSTGAVVTLPVAYEDVAFTRVEKDGVVLEVNTESAIEQLERYKLLMDNYVDHNCSITVSYDPSEVPQIVEWLYENWDSYVGVSWLYRNDPTKTAQDLGYPYLPQEVVTEEVYREYVAKLQPINLDGANSFEEIQDRECATGACPIR